MSFHTTVRVELAQQQAKLPQILAYNTRLLPTHVWCTGPEHKSRTAGQHCQDVSHPLTSMFTARSLQDYESRPCKKTYLRLPLPALTSCDGCRSDSSSSRTPTQLAEIGQHVQEMPRKETASGAVLCPGSCMPCCNGQHVLE